jgi:hypothetical protein
MKFNLLIVMKKHCFRLLLVTALLFCGSFQGFSQHTTEFVDLIVKAPGFDASKQIESIKNQANGSNGLVFVAWYKQADILHFRIDKSLNTDNILVYNLFPDLNFTLIENQEETGKILTDLTTPKTEIINPTIKTE